MKLLDHVLDAVVDRDVNFRLTGTGIEFFLAGSGIGWDACGFDRDLSFIAI